MTTDVFRFSILNGTAKAPAVDFLRLTALRDTSFLNPEKYDSHPRAFYMDVLPRATSLLFQQLKIVDSNLKPKVYTAF